MLLSAQGTWFLNPECQPADSMWSAVVLGCQLQAEAGKATCFPQLQQAQACVHTHSFFLTSGPFSLVSSPPKKPFMFSVFFSSRSAMSFFSASQLLADFR